MIRINKFIVLITIILSYINGVGQSDKQYLELIKKADNTYKIKDYKLSVDYFEEAFRIDNTKAVDLFNAACSAALNGDTLKAFDFLNLSIKNGYNDLNHIEKDCDLYTLRTLPQWGEVINKIKDNFISSDELLKSIEESFESNNPEKLWDLSNDTFKKVKNKDVVFQIVNDFHEVLNKYNLKFSDLTESKTTSFRVSYINRRREELLEIKYILTPKIIDESTKEYFIKSIGYKINIKLKLQQNTWALSDIEIKNNYLNKEFDCSGYISEYFNDTISKTCQMGVITANKQIASLSSYDSNDIDFSDSFKNLKWQEFNDIPITDDFVIFKIFFLKKTNKQKEKSDNILESLLKSTVTHEYLEIIFIDKTSNMIVSNGEMYGIYKGSNTELKKWILEELNKIE